MGAQFDLSQMFQSVRRGEWGTLLEKPKGLDRDSPEAKAAERLIVDLGFTHFIFINRYVLPIAGPIQIAISNWSDEWHERYWNTGYIRTDPVVAKMLTAYRPFDWRDLPPLSSAQLAFFQDAVRYGLADGIAGALRVGSDQAAFFSISSDKPCSLSAKREAMAAVFLFAGEMYDTVRGQIMARYQLPTISLTARQREALQLTLRGLSRRAASREMRCSESNYVRHVDAARRKLGEETTAGALRKALAMNLIRPYDTAIADPPPNP